MIYEFQTMMAGLTGLDVSNASVYDGASGLAESILMAVRANRKASSRTILMPATVHPHYAAAARAIVSNQEVAVDPVPMTPAGTIDRAALEAAEPPAALVLQQPNFFGLLEDVGALTDWAHSVGALVIAVVNPMTLAILSPPGAWGAAGADIACGDGQPFGIPIASGGPSFGFLCARQALVRQMPGRIIGRTEDLEGRPGFTLTLQAREQHIRRGKATSNICTNQGLLVTAGTIYLSLMGPEGLRRVAGACHSATRSLVAALTDIDGVEERFDGPYFHERVIDLPAPAADVVDALLDRGILGGLDLGRYFPDMASSLMVCATEKRTAEEIDRFRAALAEVLS
jgi:glycine dehydrogenase subunit 1